MLIRNYLQQVVSFDKYTQNDLQKVIKKEQSKHNLQWVYGPRTKVEKTIEKIIEELCGNDEFEN